MLSKLCLTLVILIVTTTNAQRQPRRGLGNPHEHIDMLDSQGKYFLEWVYDQSQNRITFNVTVQTQGYIWFGLSTKGELQGADIVTGGVDANGNSYFVDRHGVSNQELGVDQSQDWLLHLAQQNGTHTFLSFSRQFDTCDPNDYIINQYDVTTLIWAYGATDNWSETRHQGSGTYVVYLMDGELMSRTMKMSSFQPGPPSREDLSKEGLQLWTISSEFDLPPEPTRYQCTVHKAPRLGTKHHIVGFEVRLDNPSTKMNVHHALFYRCTPPPNTDPVQFFGQHLNSSGDECYFLSRPTGQIPTQYCIGVTMGWSVGGRMMFLPEYAGMPFGESVDEYYVLQTHYDNPNRTQIRIDYQIDIFYTRPSQEDVGTITVGHHIPGSPSILVPPNSLDHHVFGHCSPDCTTKMFPPEGIFVFGVVQHAHFSVRNFKIRHFRGEQELPWIVNDRNIDSIFQPTRITPIEINIRPGDQLVVECGYNNTWLNGSVVGGFSTSHEMCLAYLFYHNKLPDYGLCRSEISSQEYMRRYLGVSNITWSNSQLDYVATSPESLAGQSMAQISDRHVDWTRELREQLQRDHKNLPQVSGCSRSPFSSIGQGQVEERDVTSLVFHPTVQNEYAPPVRNNCNTRKFHGRQPGNKRWRWS